MGYVKMTYRIPASANYYRYLGTGYGDSEDPALNGLMTIVGVPTAASSTGASETTGLCDQMTVRDNGSTYIFGLAVGNCTENGTASGLFSFTTRNYANHQWDNIGYRTKLIKA